MSEEHGVEQWAIMALLVALIALVVILDGPPTSGPFSMIEVKTELNK